MKYCTNCGKQCEDNAKFCKSCGAPLRPPSSNINRINKKNDDKNKILIAVAIIALISIISIGTYFIFFNHSPSETFLLNENNGGNVLANKHISNNMPDSNVVNDISNLAKKGTPVYKIGDGSAPVSIVVAGTFGDQLDSQIAALYLIDFLEDKKVSGTIYVIPFLSPSATEHNTKLTGGVNLNKVANKPGYSSNDLVNFANSVNATAVGDFHGTKIGANPGKTSIICSKSPNYESYNLAIKMNLYNASSVVIPYKQAGEAYTGAIEDILNLNGITSVTPLVLSNHGSYSYLSAKTSFIQMFAFLNANGHKIND